MVLVKGIKNMVLDKIEFSPIEIFIKIDEKIISYDVELPKNLGIVIIFQIIVIYKILGNLHHDGVISPFIFEPIFLVIFLQSISVYILKNIINILSFFKQTRLQLQILTLKVLL
jgi:hypothetical protein